MKGTIHALDFLQDRPTDLPSVAVMFGPERFLVRCSLQVVKDHAIPDDNEFSISDFSGDTATWRDVCDELSTIGLFSASGRVVVVDGADSLVNQNRDAIENYVAGTNSNNFLVLIVNTWPANTRLYKQIDKVGLQIDCRPPLKRNSKSSIDLNRIATWAVAWGREHHGVRLSRQAAERVLDLVGPEFGLIDQELAKLALYVEGDQELSVSQVDQFVGGWRCQTIWEAVDAATEGNIARAIALMDRLLQAGEEPLALFGQISWSLRRFANATQRYQAAERNGESISLPQAMTAAGFRDWPRGELQKSVTRLRKIGRQRAMAISTWLMEVDLSLKGSHGHSDRGRHALETLLIRLTTA